jgi:osmotically inducible protein OsmC
MTIRTAEAEWQGSPREGKGRVRLGSGAFEGAYSFRSRMGDGVGGTNPEELIGAAHASCFTMALNGALTGAGYTPTRVHTTARVHINAQGNNSFSISPIELETEAVVPGLDDATFQRIASGAKQNCPVSKALAGAEIRLKATLLSA